MIIYNYAPDPTPPANVAISGHVESELRSVFLTSAFDGLRFSVRKEARKGGVRKEVQKRCILGRRRVVLGVVVGAVGGERAGGGRTGGIYGN